MDDYIPEDRKRQGVQNAEHALLVDFYGDEITMAVVQLEQHTQLYVPLRPICTYLGLSWSGQRERTTRDPVLLQEVRFVRLTRTNLGGNPEILCLPLE